MARSESAIVNWSQYLAVRGLAGFLQCFDVEQNLHTARVVGSVFYHTNRRRRERTERNIAMSFPEWPEARVKQTAERSLQHMFQLFLVDAFAAPRLITPETWPRYFGLHNVPRVLDDLLHGRPAIFITGHCGNWELLGYGLSMLGYSLNALARPLDNPLVNRWLLEHREARGLRIITKFGASPEIQEILRAGGRLGFIADQNAGEQGLFVPFFGRLASSYKSIGLLAMRYHVPIVAAHGRRLGGRMRYAMEITDVIDPDDWEGQPDPLYYITARFNRAMEQMVRRAPEQYLWLHRRWKSRPKHERLGRPFPAVLRRRLEALPWMTQEELDRLVALSEDPDHHEVA
ncbi:MAG: lysophospholipid acyltransferase family protein [Planctomycetes bacterium]|nr:lysophospholipid acyltransferase family protein [Planctomycetota bacterium]